MTEQMILFPFSDYWWFYLLFNLFVLMLLALDLGVFHRDAHKVSFKEAGVWTIVWISLALIFNVGFYYYCLERFSSDPTYALTAAETSKRLALEFFTGFIIEKSLSIDNLFVFVTVFSFFGIPDKFQHRVLFYGILGALIFRAIFIALGSVLMQYHWIVVFFGALLIITGIKMFFTPKEVVDPSKNIIVRTLKKYLPITPNLHEQKFLIREKGVLYGTPLLLTLVFIEFTDIIFAVDSVPAIFALTKEPLIVFTSNVFAILGLRSMYFMLAGVYDKFALLKYGLGVVLIFVGLKMVYLNEAFGGKFPITWSLGFIFGTLIITIVISLIWNKKQSAA